MNLRISPKWVLAGLLALDVVGNHAHVTSWTVGHTISGVGNVFHAAATAVRDTVNGWTSDNAVAAPRHRAAQEFRTEEPRPQNHLIPRPGS